MTTHVHAAETLGNGDTGVLDDDGDIRVVDDVTEGGIPRPNDHRIALMHPHQVVPETEPEPEHAEPTASEASVDLGMVAARGAGISQEAYDEASGGVAGFVESLTSEQKQAVLDIVHHINAVRIAVLSAKKKGVYHKTRQMYRSKAKEHAQYAAECIEELTGTSSNSDDDQFPRYLWWKTFFTNNRTSLEAAIHETEDDTTTISDEEIEQALEQKERFGDLGVSWRQ